LEEQNKNVDYIIKGKPQEKDEPIKSLTFELSSMKYMINLLVKGLSEPKNQKQYEFCNSIFILIRRNKRSKLFTLFCIDQIIFKIK
jgi:hypothetical protein